MLSITTASKTDKKDILRFYKQQHYSARFLGFDHCYVIKSNQQIIASVIVSMITQNNNQAFLHALVVDTNYRHQHLASMLLQHCIRQHLELVCFAQLSLAPLYINNGFVQAKINSLTPELQQRYQRYLAKNSDLLPFYSLLKN